MRGSEFKLKRRIEALEKELKQEKRKYKILEELKTRNELNYISSLNELRTTHDELKFKNSELQRTQELVVKSEGLANSASQAKSVFLAKMSHELRTPLTAIIGYAELLLEEELKDKPQSIQDIELIVNSGRHLLSLVNDILDISKIEAGKVSIHYEDFELYELLRHLSNECSPLFQKNNNTFTLRDDKPLTIHSDKKAVRQCIYNLLSNASKFTQEGEIKLSCIKTDKDIHIIVSDTGIGMDQDQIKYIFDEFSQAHAGIGSKFGGTGLGLSIIKGMVNLLGGNIQVESNLNEGSVFSISLPIDPK